MTVTCVCRFYGWMSGVCLSLSCRLWLFVDLRVQYFSPPRIQRFWVLRVSSVGVNTARLWRPRPRVWWHTCMPGVWTSRRSLESFCVLCLLSVTVGMFTGKLILTDTYGSFSTRIATSAHLKTSWSFSWTNITAHWGLNTESDIQVLDHCHIP